MAGEFLSRCPIRLGLAAGIDRLGSDIATYARTGVGALEVGTVRLGEMPAVVANLDRWRAVGEDRAMAVGVNFACERDAGPAQAVAECTRLAAGLAAHCDYLVVNLSTPDARIVDAADQEEIEHLLLAVRRAAGPGAMLLVKLTGLRPALPLERVASLGYDAAVVEYDQAWPVSAAQAITARLRTKLGDAALVAVGGVRTAAAARERLLAGAALVQVHRAFSIDGPANLRRLLRGIGDPATA